MLNDALVIVLNGLAVLVGLILLALIYAGVQHVILCYQLAIRDLERLKFDRSE